MPNMGPCGGKFYKRNHFTNNHFHTINGETNIEATNILMCRVDKTYVKSYNFLNDDITYTGLSSNSPIEAIIDARIVKSRKSNENEVCPRIAFTTCKTVKRARILRLKSLLFLLSRSFSSKG